MKDGETRYACPQCGCSADSFIFLGGNETTSSYSVSNAESQNRVMGDNISNQPAKGYKVICPDCGAVFEDTVPAECPNCACPSEQFKRQGKEISQSPSARGKNSIIGVIFIVLIIGAIGGFTFYKIASTLERERQEQYEKEQRENEARAQEEQRRKVQEADRKLFKKMTGTYVSQYFYHQGSYIKYRISLYSGGNYEIEILNDYNRVVHRRTGRWEACSASNVIALDVDSRSGDWGGAIGIVGNHLEFGGVECY